MSLHLFLTAILVIAVIALFLVDVFGVATSIGVTLALIVSGIAYFTAQADTTDDPAENGPARCVAAVLQAFAEYEKERGR